MVRKINLLFIFLMPFNNFGDFHLMFHIFCSFECFAASFVTLMNINRCRDNAARFGVLITKRIKIPQRKG